jgi:O-6-methylguanine DNA methyltransferase
MYPGIPVVKHDKGNTQPVRLLCRAITHRVTDVTLFAEADDMGTLRICAVFLGNRSRLNGRRAVMSDHPQLRRYAALIGSWLSGNGDRLDRIPLMLRGADFQRKVLESARRIPRGTTVSYAQLVRMAGYPRAVRGAATVMRNNPLPLLIPCHRVVRSDGSIGGFMGKTAGKAIMLKRRLLALDGVQLR